MAASRKLNAFLSRHTSPKHVRRLRPVPCLESLETRNMLAGHPFENGTIQTMDDDIGIVVVVTGTDQPDVVTAKVEGDQLVVTLNEQSETFANDRVRAIHVDVQRGADTVMIDASVKQPARILGGDDNDTLHGGSGNDQIYGGRGSDVIDGAAGHDSLYGDDVPGRGHPPDRGPGIRPLPRGPRLDLAPEDVEQSEEDPPPTPDPGNGHDDSDMIHGGDGNDRIRGGRGNDILLGENGNDDILGGDGHDLILAGRGNDRADGGNGNDVIYGGWGSDYLRGGRGNDVIVGDPRREAAEEEEGKEPELDPELYPPDIIATDEVPEADEGEEVAHRPGRANDLIFGDDGDDILLGRMGNDRMYGGDGDDTLDGGSGNDYLRGGRGMDTLLGRSGRDFLFGDQDNDTLNGGKDSDFLVGGHGADKLYAKDGTRDILLVDTHDEVEKDDIDLVIGRRRL